MKIYVKKPLGKRICKICNKEYPYYDSKQMYCGECAHGKKYCPCGCGKEVSWYNTYHPGYHTKGKTYLEIYGKKEVKNGFKKGEFNLAKTFEVREKKRKAVLGECYGFRNKTPEQIEKYREEVGDRLRRGIWAKRKGKYCSSLEKDFALFLEKNSLEYEYEKCIRMINGRRKYVDFVVGNILIEITGFAYKSWREDFCRKIKILRQSTDSPILVLTYPEYEEGDEIREILDLNVYIGNVKDERDTLEKIRFIQVVEKARELERKGLL